MRTLRQLVFRFQLRDFAFGDAALFAFVVDGEEVDVGIYYIYENVTGDDPCAAALALVFGGDCHADFSCVVAQIIANGWICQQFFFETYQVIWQRAILFCQRFNFFVKILSRYYFVIHQSVRLRFFSFSCRLT